MRQNEVLKVQWLGVSDKKLKRACKIKVTGWCNVWDHQDTSSPATVINYIWITPFILFKELFLCLNVAIYRLGSSRSTPTPVDITTKTHKNVNVDFASWKQQIRREDCERIKCDKDWSLAMNKFTTLTFYLWSFTLRVTFWGRINYTDCRRTITTH
jgi:hypothetical protein